MAKEPKIDKVILEEGQISVSRTMLNTSPKTKQEKIIIRPFITSTATVGASLARTINLGNFENLKVSIFISAPCYVEEIVDVYNQVKAMAEDLLGEEVGKIMGDKE